MPINSRADYSFQPMNLWQMSALFLDADDIDAVVGPLIFLAIVGSLLFYGFRRWRLRTAPKRWTMTDATIQSDMPSNPRNAGGTAALHGALVSAAVSHY